MGQCAVYTRVSTDEQETSIINQKAYFMDYIEKRQWTLFDIYTDEAFTGTESTKRLAFQRLLLDGKARKYHILLAKSYSRFGRNQRETLEAIAKLRSYGVRIIFIEDHLDSETDAGKFGLFAWLAEQEAQKVSERIKYTWHIYDEKGKIHAPHPPYGYDYAVEQKTFVINTQEAEIVREIFDLYLQGNGMTKIANILRNKGVQTKKDGEWANATIRGILSNEVYIGSLVQGKTRSIDVTIKKRKKIDKKNWIVHEGKLAPIIEKEKFDKVQKEIKMRSGKYGRSRHSNKALFSNLIECPSCGGAFTVKRQRHFKHYAPYYSCINYELKGAVYAGHSRIAIYEEVLIQGLTRYFEILKTDHGEMLERWAEQNEKKVKKPKDLNMALKATDKALAKNTALSMTLLRAFGEGLIGETQFKLQNEEIEKVLKSLTQRKEQLLEEIRTNQSVKGDNEYIKNRIERLLEVKHWTNNMLRQAVEKLYVYGDGTIYVKLRFNPEA